MVNIDPQGMELLKNQGLSLTFEKNEYVRVTIIDCYFPWCIFFLNCVTLKSVHHKSCTRLFL